MRTEAAVQSVVAHEVSRPELLKKYAGNWVWRTVASLLSFRDEPNVREMARRLGVPRVEVFEALEGLKSLGMISMDATGRFRRNENVVFVNPKTVDGRDLLAQHALITTQVLNRMRAEDSPFYKTSFLASKKELVDAFYAKVEKLVVELIRESDACEPDQVYAFTLSALNVSGTKELSQ